MKTVSILAMAGSAAAAVISMNQRDFEPVTKLRVARDGSPSNECENKDEPCTLISASEETTYYGDRPPREVSDGLWDECLDIGCNDVEWEAGTKDLIMSGKVDDTVSAKATGTWHTDHRHALIWSMTELVGAMQETYEYEVTTGPLYSASGKLKMDVWKAPKNMQINRYVWKDDEWLLQGYISFTAEMQEDEGAFCTNMLGTLTSLGGVLVPQVGPILGSIRGVC